MDQNAVEPVGTTAAAQPQGAPAETVQQGTANRPAAIPIPTEKWGAVNRENTSMKSRIADLEREVSQYRGETAQGSQQFTNPSPQPDPLDPNANKALDLIADRMESRFGNTIKEELGSVNQELDRLKFDRMVTEMDDDPKMRYIIDETTEELRNLAKRSPKSKMSDLLVEAKRAALDRAFSNGTLMTRIMEEAATEANERVSDKTRASSVPAGHVPSEVLQEPTDLESMTPEQLASDPERFNKIFESQYGRRPRR